MIELIKSLTLSDSDVSKRIAISGKTISFNPGLNYIAGRNGSGKSTLVQMLYKFSILRCSDQEKRKSKAKQLGIESIDMYSEEKCTLRFFDSEHTPRNESNLHPEINSNDITTMIFSNRISHGQFSKKVMESLKGFSENDIIIIDEPEVGLDLQATLIVKSLLEEVSDRVQLIVVTHNPILLNSSRCNYICLGGFDVKSYIESYRALLN
jgi:predicted ATPase